MQADSSAKNTPDVVVGRARPAPGLLDMRGALLNYPARRMPVKRSVRNKLSRQKQRNLDVQIQFMEGIVRRDPGFVEALQLLGDHYSRRGNQLRKPEGGRTAFATPAAQSSECFATSLKGNG